MIIAFWCTGFFEVLFFLLYWNTYKRYQKIKGTGRVHDIVYTKNWAQFFKILVIFLPVLLLLFVKDAFL